MASHSKQSIITTMTEHFGSRFIVHVGFDWLGGIPGNMKDKKKQGPEMSLKAFALEGGRKLKIVDKSEEKNVKKQRDANGQSERGRCLETSQCHTAGRQHRLGAITGGAGPAATNKQNVL